MCAAIFGFGLVGSVVMLLVIVLGPIPGSNTNIGLGAVFYTVSKALLTTLQFKVSMFLAVGVVIGVWLSAVYQLYRLFGNLAAGAIYTPENVRRVRYVGLLWLLSAVLGIVIPAALVVARGFIDTSVPIDLDRPVPFVVAVDWQLRFGRPHPARLVDHGRRPVREGSRGRAEARRRSRDLNGASTCQSW